MFYIHLMLYGCHFPFSYFYSTPYDDLVYINNILKYYLIIKVLESTVFVIMTFWGRFAFMKFIIIRNKLQNDQSRLNKLNLNVVSLINVNYKSDRQTCQKWELVTLKLREKITSGKI